MLAISYDGAVAQVYVDVTVALLFSTTGIAENTHEL